MWKHQLLARASVTSQAGGEQLGEKLHATVIVRALLDRQGTVQEGELVGMDGTVFARFAGWPAMVEALEQWVQIIKRGTASTGGPDGGASVGRSQSDSKEGGGAVSAQDEATVVFRGTVEQLKAATLAAVTPTDETAVVRVDEMVRAPVSLGLASGTTVTVLLSQSPRLKEQQEALFFTTGWLYGESIALKEVAPAVIGQDMAGAQGRLSRTESGRQSSDEPLRSHMAAADAIVSGMVNAVRVPSAPTGPPVLTHHDPHWREAVIQVGSVEKGQVPGDTVVVRFADSHDIAWRQAPKLHAGQKGVWLLHREAAEAGAPPAHVILHPLDSQPLDRLPQLRNLSGAGAMSRRTTRTGPSGA